MNFTFLLIFFTVFDLIILIIFVQLAVFVCYGRLLAEPRSAEHSVLIRVFK